MKIKGKGIEFEMGKNGVIIWVDGTWVLDASLFKEDLTITLDSDRMKPIKRPYKTHQPFKLIIPKKSKRRTK